MKILYIDSVDLSFNLKLQRNTTDTFYEELPAFETLKDVTAYFNSKIDFDLILYNPYIFMTLIQKNDYAFQSFIDNLAVRLIPYSNPSMILPTSQAIENKLIDIFPLKSNQAEPVNTNGYNGKCVLVTGAGGSIGSELVLQLLENEVKICICLDLSEFSIFNLRSKLSESDLSRIELKVGSYGDKELLSDIFLKYNIDIIINAAAYKHVSIMEGIPKAAFKNNIANFISLLETAKSYNVNDIIQVSTDKAANPSNIMGFSKFICEQLLTNANKFMGSSFNYSIVRFGNVVGSSGSVAPIFINNIKNNKKLKITHKDVNRFMMKIDDAVNLILFAARVRKNETYVLDMGESYKIIDLAKAMLKHTFYSYDENMIEFIGLEKGEKLSESLFTDSEKDGMVKNDHVFILKNKRNSTLTDKELTSLYTGDLSLVNDIFSRIKS